MKRSLVIVLLALVCALPALAGEKEDYASQAWPVIERATRSGDMLARARALLVVFRFPGREKDADSYIREGLKDPQWVVRKAAMKVLVAAGDPEARKGATDALRDGTLPLEDDAFDILAAFKPADARAALLGALLDPAVPTRDKLMTAVLAQPLETQVAVFAAGLARGDAFFVAKLGDVRRELKVPLAEALLKDKDPKVQAQALAFVRDRELKVAPAMPKALLKSADTEVRYTAAEILAAGGDSAAVKTLNPLADGDAAAQLRFLKAAAIAPSADLLPTLKKFLAPNTPAELLVHVYSAFAGTQDEEVRKRVESDLQSTEMARRAAATRALGRLLGNRALPKLNALLVDGSPLVRKLAAEAIGDLAQAESVEVLERALRDTETDVRLAVIRALARIHDKSVIGVASFVVYDSDPLIRKTAILAICNVNHESALPILRINVEDPDPEIRYNVIKALIYLDPAQATEHFDRALAGLKADDLVSLVETFKEGFVPYLKRAAACERAWARTGAIRAAAGLPTAIETEFLKEVALTSAHADARKAALGRLEVLSCVDATTVAQAVLQDRDPEARIAAVNALVNCGDNGTAPLILGALMDIEENVRVAAAAGILEFPKAAGKRPAGGKTPGKEKKGK